MSSSLSKPSFYDRFSWEQTRPTNLSRRAKIVITAVVAIAHILLFPLIVNSLGPAGSALVIFPVAIIARIWGFWGGVLAGLIAAPANVLLFNLMGSPITFRGGVSGAVTVIVLGAVVGWLSDLLERIYQQSQELAAARDQALEASKLKSMMLSKVSHELRTPLGAVLGYAELLAEGTYGPVNERQCQKLGNIVTAAQELEVLISDLLDMSRIETGRLQLFPEPMAVAELVESVEMQTAVAAQQKGLRMRCLLDPDMPAVIIGDRARISQILVNLVTNSVKYTEQGDVIIEIYPDGSDQWTMKVTDTGVGIPAEEQEHIFEAFRQSGAASSHARGGIGLGLSIVCELVTLMNGHINVNSVVGQGSSFTVTLPLVQPTTEKE